MANAEKRIGFVIGNEEIIETEINGKYIPFIIRRFDGESLKKRLEIFGNGRTALEMGAVQWEAVVPDYVIPKCYLDPRSIWQRNHENNRNERRRTLFTDEKDPYPTFETVFERSMQYFKKTQRPLQVVGGSWISGDDRRKICMLSDGSLKVKPRLIP